VLFQTVFGGHSKGNP